MTDPRFDLDAQMRLAQDSYRNEHTNSLIGEVDRPAPGTMNAFRSMTGNPGGTLEYVKAYMHQFGAGTGDYTEGQLSPQGQDAIRKMAQMSYGTGVTNYPQPDDTGMSSTLGRVAPGNIRKVIIGRVPYWQVLDRYDFNAEANDANTGHKQEMVNHLIQHGISDYRSKKIIPSLMGLGYNVNFLVPVIPGQHAPADLVEAHRQRTSLENNPAFPNRTLGAQAVNALINSPQTPGQPYEKAMP